MEKTEKKCNKCEKYTKKDWLTCPKCGKTLKVNEPQDYINNWFFEHSNSSNNRISYWGDSREEFPHYLLNNDNVIELKKDIKTFFPNETFVLSSCFKKDTWGKLEFKVSGRNREIKIVATRTELMEKYPILSLSPEFYNYKSVVFVDSHNDKGVYSFPEKNTLQFWLRCFDEVLTDTGKFALQLQHMINCVDVEKRPNILRMLFLDTIEESKTDNTNENQPDPHVSN